ncbi:MAG TPA: ASCH domain-containing protein [Mollicutes bacterium]|nr:ASCH domain-containing protein [Mollicutes bacterium]
MKVITIKQPWASLIAYGYKRYEFRSWKTNYRGPIYIHAGKGVDKTAMKDFEYLNIDYPKSKIVAQVYLEDCVFIDSKVDDKLKKENKKLYSGHIGNYAWKLSGVKKIKNNRHINGQLGLWNIEDL